MFPFVSYDYNYNGKKNTKSTWRRFCKLFDLLSVLNTEDSGWHKEEWFRKNRIILTDTEIHCQKLNVFSWAVPSWQEPNSLNMIPVLI